MKRQNKLLSEGKVSRKSQVADLSLQGISSNQGCSKPVKSDVRLATHRDASKTSPNHWDSSDHLLRRDFHGKCLCALFLLDATPLPPTHTLVWKQQEKQTLQDNFLVQKGRI